MDSVSSPVADARWLAAHLDEPSLVVCDCRFQLADPKWGERQYRTSHIPGARYLHLERDLSGPLERYGGRHPLPDPNQLAATLGANGIDNATTVIAYDDSHFAFAARLWWLLRWLGHERVAVLDGGWRQWQGGDYPVSSETVTPRPTQFVAAPRPGWTVDITAVEARKDSPDVALVDSRDRDRYAGKRELIDPIAGSIPGAVNVPWREVTDADGYLRSEVALRDRWSEIAATERIVYCGSGVTACVNLLSLHAIGLSARLYPGGWSDWCAHLTFPESAEELG